MNRPQPMLDEQREAEWADRPMTFLPESSTRIRIALVSFGAPWGDGGSGGPCSRATLMVLAMSDDASRGQFCSHEMFRPQEMTL